MTENEKTYFWLGFAVGEVVMLIPFAIAFIIKLII